MEKNDRPKICICLTGETIAEDLRILERYRSMVDYAELRADCLDPNERFYIRSFPEKAGLPCILTIRRLQDGGKFEDGEGVRLVLFAKALSFPKAEASANYAFVDLECDFKAPVVEEACHTFGTRIVRSLIYRDSLPENLDTAYDQLTLEEDEIPKLTVNPQNSADFIRFLEWSLQRPKRDQILIARGPYGIVSRILAWRLGSMWTYASPLQYGMEMAAPGHLDPQDLVNIYNFDLVDPDTVIYTLIGQHSIAQSLSPYLHNTAFRKMGKNALLVPTPVDSFSDGLKILEMLGGKGAAITVPFKEDVLPFLAIHSTDVKRIGACNTLVWRDSAWAGYNTDADGFERSLLEFLGKQDISGCRATLIGAGGAAKSIALALFRKGAHALVLNRTYSAGRDLARKYDFSYTHLDDRAIDQISEYSNLIVQATSLGMKGESDPINFYEFKGSEAVFDLIYHPSKTVLLKRAEAAGCRTINGYKMLCYQAAGQYKLWMNEPPPDIYAQLEQPESS
ncbi:3-dehydroquinate dehydratase [uncultured spirochete]|uniref:shikimate dehydrogenase (NADP(+)) n=1 Tax=uncultured spirochete TaxID=156406 RepID=A0A3P3XPU0_9SPIR|nr:3-dehydroquinate dehydratase [uncultured spirochete]